MIEPCSGPSPPRSLDRHRGDHASSVSEAVTPVTSTVPAHFSCSHHQFAPIAFVQQLGSTTAMSSSPGTDATQAVCGFRCHNCSVRFASAGWLPMKEPGTK